MIISSTQNAAYKHNTVNLGMLPYGGISAMHAGRSMTLNLQTKSKFDLQELPLQKVSMDCPTCVSIPKPVNVVCSRNVFRLYVQSCLQTLRSPKSIRANTIEPMLLAAQWILIARLIIRFLLNSFAFWIEQVHGFLCCFKIHFSYYSFSFSFILCFSFFRVCVYMYIYTCWLFFFTFWRQSYTLLLMHSENRKKNYDWILVGTVLEPYVRMTIKSSALLKASLAHFWGNKFVA